MAEARRPLRVMADANILIAGLLFPRWFYEFLRHAALGDFTLVLCPYVIEEATRRLDLESPTERDALDCLRTACDAEIVPDPTPEEIDAYRHLVRDPKDVPVALAAIAARVDYLVSNDKDLTAIDVTTERLREHIRPMTVGRFLHEVMGWPSDELERIRLRTWQHMGPTRG